MAMYPVGPIKRGTRYDTSMDISLKMLSTLLIDLEIVNEEKLDILNKQLNDLTTFDKLVVSNKGHLKVHQIRGCVVIDKSHTEDFGIGDISRNYPVGIKTWVPNEMDEICSCIYKMSEIYNSCRPEHISLVEKDNRSYYIPLEEIDLYIKSLDELIKEEKVKISAFVPTTCMLRGCTKGIAYKFISHLPKEEGKDKVMCLECQFAFFDKNIVEILSKEDQCVDATACDIVTDRGTINSKEEDVEREEETMKKRKIDTLH